MSTPTWLGFLIGVIAMGVTPAEWNFFRRVCGCIAIALALLFLYWIAKGVTGGN